MTDLDLNHVGLTPVGGQVPLYVYGAILRFLDPPLPKEGEILTLSSGTRIKVTVSTATGVIAEKVKD